MGFFSFSSRSKKRYGHHYGGHHYKRESMLDKLGRMIRSHSYSSRKHRYGRKYSSSFSGRHHPYGYGRRYRKSSWS